MRVPELVWRAARPLLDRGDRVLDATSAAVGDASRTVKFLRGRAAFVPRRDDVFVASYPRSGTTWAQVIVYLLVSGDDDFDFAHIAEVAPWWERSLAWRGVRAADDFAQLANARVFKTHLPYLWLPPRSRCLYMFRNPEDVAVSYYHLYQRYLGFAGSFDDFFARFVAGDVQYRSWFRHVQGWRSHPGDGRVLLVSYDEMRHDTALWVRRIAEFLEVDASPARIASVVAQSEFDRMKAVEHKFDHEGELLRQWGIRPGSFLRAGRVAHGDGVVSTPQRKHLRAASERRRYLPQLEWRLADFLH